MAHRRLLVSYMGIMGAVFMSLGGYVACGAQQYRVPIHGNEPELSGRRPDGGGSTFSAPAGQNLFGVHSNRGWARSLPIRFKTSKEIPREVVEQLQGAMKTWEAAVGKQLFSYEGEDERGGESFPNLFAPLDDGVNGHYYDFKWTLATGKSSSVLATTIWENDPRDPAAIKKADIRYNSEFYVFGDSLRDYSQGRRTIVDMESLALHELGHLLGLSHVSEQEDRYSVMNPALFIGEGMITRRLSHGDIERVRTVYGVGDATLADTLERADDFAQTN